MRYHFTINVSGDGPDVRSGYREAIKKAQKMNLDWLEEIEVNCPQCDKLTNLETDSLFEHFEIECEHCGHSFEVYTH